MRKMPEYSRWLQRVSIPTTAVLVLMIFLLAFSQMIMEASAYSFMLKKHKVINEKKNEALINYYKNAKKAKTKADKPKNDKSKTATQAFIKPIEGGVTTSYFGDTEDRKLGHKGHDWAVPVGTPVMAAADGIVTKAYLSDSYGNNIVMEHNNGTMTRYAHLSKIKVVVGETVKQGKVIGLSGNTGDSTGPHLHFEVIVGGMNVNPLNFIAIK